MSAYNEELYLEMVENEQEENATFTPSNVAEELLTDMFNFN